jgi:hypothetical protein
MVAFCNVICAGITIDNDERVTIHKVADVLTPPGYPAIYEGLYWVGLVHLGDKEIKPVHQVRQIVLGPPKQTPLAKIETAVEPVVIDRHAHLRALWPLSFAFNEPGEHRLQLFVDDELIAETILHLRLRNPGI